MANRDYKYIETGERGKILMRRILMILIILSACFILNCKGESPINIEPPDDHHGPAQGYCPHMKAYYLATDCGNCHDH